jgi:hypothetical protein
VYDGPDVLVGGEVARIDLTNSSEESAFIGLIPLAEEVTLEEIGTPTGDGQPPDFLVIFEAVGQQLPPGGEASVTTPPLAPREYVAICTGAIPQPVAIISVR